MREVVENLAGRIIQVGPLRVGPRRAATVDVKGTVRMPRLAARAGDPVQFDLSIPVTLDITVAVLSDNRYRAEVEIPLVLIARAADPLFVVIDAVPPEAHDIVVDLRARTRRARVLGVLAGIRGQIAAQVARVVVTELADPSIRIIDVADRITAATG